MTQKTPPISQSENRSTQSTRQILRGPNHTLHALYAETRKLRTISEIVEDASGVTVAVSSFQNNHLVVSVATAAFATKLRYRQQNILASLRRRNFEARSIQIKVQPEFFKAPGVHIERSLSPDAARQLVQTAEHIEDEDLGRALTRLARNADRPQE